MQSLRQSTPSREPLHTTCIVSGVTVTLQFPDPAVGISKTVTTAAAGADK
jgi:hypothetical protein